MKSVLATMAAAAALSLASAASAASFSGSFWNAPANSLDNIDDAISFAGSNPIDATFTSTSIAYGDGPGFQIGTLSQFLNADAGSIVGDGSQNIQESVFRLDGFVRLNQGDQVNVTSDDGFRILLDGSLFSEFVGLRAPNTTSTAFTGPSGTYATTLWYFEGKQFKAQLQSDLAPVDAPIPLPAGGVLLLSALASGGVIARRRPA